MRYVRKRDGKLEEFNGSRIEKAIWKAARAVGGRGEELAAILSWRVIAQLE